MEKIEQTEARANEHPKRPNGRPIMTELTKKQSTGMTLPSLEVYAM